LLFKGSRKYWAIAIVCGLIAAVLSYQYLHAVKNRYRPDDLVKVVKALKDIPKDTMITDDKVTVIEIPSKYSHPDALQSREAVIGKTAFVDINAGEEILSRKIVGDANRKDRLAYNVPQGMRAVSIPVDDVSGVGNYIKPGDKVDVMATVDIDTGGGGNTYTVLTLQNIEVLAVGSFKDMSGKKTDNSKPILILAVSVAQASPLVLASERGNLRLLLRPPVDQSTTYLAPLQLQNLIQ
jgi:pilus assembly protein CpaB